MVAEIKLKPRLVPRPLWWLSLARLARIDSYILDIIDYPKYDVLDEWNRIWFKDIRESMISNNYCDLCGINRAKIVDEIWEYNISGNTGIARLVGLQKVCEECNLVIHYGCAQVTGNSIKAYEWMKEVNKITDYRAREIISKAFSTWRKQSEISNWTFKLDYLKNSYPELGKELEFILNKLYNLTLQEYLLDQAYLRIIRGSFPIFPRTTIRLDKQPTDLTIEIINKCKEHGLNYDHNSLAIAIYLAYLDAILRELRAIIRQKENPKLLGETEDHMDYSTIIRKISETLSDPSNFNGPENLTEMFEKIPMNIFKDKIIDAELSGKWMFFLSSHEAFKTFKKIADAIRKRTLISPIAKISINRNPKKSQIICVYTHNFLEIDTIIKLRDQLKNLGITTYLMFKPDIFTKYKIYRETTKIRPYIYWDFPNRT